MLCINLLQLLQRQQSMICLHFPEGVTLPTGYYFGMSATTGDLSDNHDIVSIKTYELDTPASMSKEERPDILPGVQ